MRAARRAGRHHRRAPRRAVPGARRRVGGRAARRRRPGLRVGASAFRSARAGSRGRGARGAAARAERPRGARRDLTARRDTHHVRRPRPRGHRLAVRLERSRARRGARRARVPRVLPRVHAGLRVLRDTRRAHRRAASRASAPARSGGLGRHRRRADRDLPARLARRLAAHRSHRGALFRPRARTTRADPRRRSRAVPLAMIRILASGARATIQDAGRFVHLRDGIPASGPMDPFAFDAANALVGNALDAAALEIVGLPFSFVCEDRRLVVATGRDVALRGRDEIAGWTAAFARPGETYTVIGGAGARFAYLAISGGITAPPVLGSRAAYLPAGIRRPPRVGDALPLGAARVDPDRAGASLAPPDLGASVRTIPGPHLDRFGEDAVAAFFDAAFRVEAASDRMGTRLAGPPVTAKGGEILTSGIVAGAVQVPSGGAPIVLLADHQTTGGDPGIAAPLAADLGRVAQRLPGEVLPLARGDRERPLAPLRAHRELLAAIA